MAKIGVASNIKRMRAEASARGMGFEEFVVDLWANARADRRREDRTAAEMRCRVATRMDEAAYPPVVDVHDIQLPAMKERDWRRRA